MPGDEPAAPVSAQPAEERPNVAAVAARAGVGIAALYRRYRSEEELLQRLALDGLRGYLAETEAALADDGDPWEAFTRFLRRSLDSGAGSLTVRLAGAFTPTEELRRAGRDAHAATQRLLDRAKAAGVLHPDIAVGDISLLLDALHRPATPLPGPPPSWEEISRRYDGPGA
jgi:AcrR family transcriptional regulator